MTAGRFKSQVLVPLFEAVLQGLLGLPRTQPFLGLKRTALRAVGARLGKRVTIYPDVWIMTGAGLHLGDDVDLARGVLITTGGGVSIGDRTLVGYGAKILSSNHVIPAGDDQIFRSGHEHSPVSIGPDAWIGANAVVLPGVTIGAGAVVAAGAVVSKSVSPFEIVGGVPARPISQRA